MSSGGRWETRSIVSRSRRCTPARRSAPVSCSRVNGLTMKSCAPLRMAATALSIFPCRVMMTTARVGYSATQLAQDVQPALTRHGNVQKHHFGGVPADRRERLFTVTRFDRLMAFVAHELTEQVPDVSVAVDDENARASLERGHWLSAPVRCGG